MTPRLSARAKRDLDELWLSTALRTSSEAIADRLFERVWHAIDRLVVFPRIGHTRADIPAHLLAWNVGTDWTVVYEALEGSIRVVRILPASRDLAALSAEAFSGDE